MSEVQLGMNYEYNTKFNGQFELLQLNTLPSDKNHQLFQNKCN